MRWKRFIISAGLLLGAMTTAAQGCLSTERRENDAYRRHVEIRQRRWASLIPNQLVVQNAGNMGFLSAGIGWSYGRQHWETHALWGYIPRHQSSRGKLTMTLKENYIPWNIRLTAFRGSSAKPLPAGLTLSPLTASLYVNTVYGHEFWRSQPSRYPDKYYEFMSTKFRLNIALGQRVSWDIPAGRRKIAKSLSLFYEFSSCDLYIRSKIQDGSLPLDDIIGLSIGVKLQTI